MNIPRYVVDGYEFDDRDSSLLGDGQFAPFLVFDCKHQDYIATGVEPATEFATRDAAQRVADALNAAGVA